MNKPPFGPEITGRASRQVFLFDQYNPMNCHQSHFLSSRNLLCLALVIVSTVRHQVAEWGNQESTVSNRCLG